MFPTRMFADSMFAPRMFPKAGAEFAYYILISIRDELRDLNLTGISDKNINVRKVWDGTLQNTPNVQVTIPTHEQMPKYDGTNYRDDVVYQVMVTITDKKNRNPTLHRAAYLQWREDISRHFRCQPLSGQRTVFDCEVTPGDVRDRKQWANGFWVSRILLRFYSKETRG